MEREKNNIEIDGIVIDLDNYYMSEGVAICKDCGQPIHQHSICETENCEGLAETVWDESCEGWQKGDTVHTVCRACADYLADYNREWGRRKK